MAKVDGKDKLIKYSKLTNAKVYEVIKCFVEELTATEASRGLSIHRHSVERLYKYIQVKIFNEIQKDKKAEELKTKPKGRELKYSSFYIYRKNAILKYNGINRGHLRLYEAQFWYFWLHRRENLELLILKLLKSH